MTAEPTSTPFDTTSAVDLGTLQNALLRSKFAGDDLRGNLPAFPSRPSLTPLAAAAPRRARVVFVPGAAGVADALWLCLKTAADVYAWVQLDNISTAAIQALINATALGGELGGTVASGTVAATHSGSSHASLAVAIPEFITPLMLPEISITSANAQSANQAYFTPVEPLTANVTIATLASAIAVQNGNIDVGVYSFDGTTMTKVVTLGSTACPAVANFVSFNIADTAMTRGTRYFFAYATDSGTLRIAKINYGNNAVFQPLNGPFWTKASSFPLPTTVTSLTGTNQGPLLVGTITGGSTL